MTFAFRLDSSTRWCVRCHADTDRRVKGDCIPCTRRRAKEWRANNREYHRQWNREYAATHAEAVTSAILRWRADNPVRAAENHLRATHRRRARKMCAPSVKYSRSDIFERDRWTCHLCGLFIDPTLSGKLPWGVTIDHRIPISRGGADTPENVAAAHRTCNSRRHVKTILVARQVLWAV